MDRIDGIVRGYDWGDLSALSELLDRPPSGEPEAEYWLGAHPSGPATLVADGRPLDQAIAADAVGLLGHDVNERFGQLPFLVKILTARRALSIQAHPSLGQAKAGFAAEEAAGIPRQAGNRTYRDPNHKPELVCALTPFEARCGFRDPSATDRVLARFGQALEPVRERLAASGPATTALWLLGLPPDEAGPMAIAAIEAARTELDGGQDDDAAAEFASTVEVGRAFPTDVGVVVALLLNHVILEPGQALFLSAGNVHAYLKGVAIEVMANSDNVIRGGLTTKHIDVAELAAIVDRRWGSVQVQDATGPIHRFDAPIDDFALTRIDTSSGDVEGIDLDPVGPEIVLVTAGTLAVRSCGSELELTRGQAALVGPEDGLGRLVPGPDRPTVAWRVTVGLS